MKYKVPKGFVLVPETIPSKNEGETPARLNGFEYTACPTNGKTTWIGHSITYFMRNNKEKTLTQTGNTQRMR